MHHGQSRGEIPDKVFKKLVNFSKTGREIYEKREAITIFANQEGKCTKTGKLWGKFEIFGR